METEKAKKRPGEEGAAPFSKLRPLAASIAAVLSQPSCKTLESTGIPPRVDADVSDAATDGRMDGGVDGPGACAEAMPAPPWTGNIANGASEVAGGYVFTYRGPDGQSRALMDIECGMMLRYDDHPFPEDILTTLDVAADGRVIKVTPHSVGVQVNVTLEVQ